jgi:type I restriction enzyme S subunit
VSKRNKSLTTQLPFAGESGTPGWVRRNLGELCAEDRISVDPDSLLAKELPYLGLENVESVTGRIIKDVTAVSEAGGRSTTFRFDARHVLYGKLRPYLNKVALPDFEGRCTTELIPLLPRPDVSREFLAWLLRRPQTVEAAMREKTGARMPRANMRHILSLPVMVPVRLQEQQRLAAEMDARMSLVAEAKAACREQLRLLDVYAEKILSCFSDCDLRDTDGKTSGL